MNPSKFELFLQKVLHTLIQFSKKFFYAFFTAPWLWLVGYTLVLSVFFWYSYYTVVQEKNLFIQPNPARFVDSVLFTPGTSSNPVNYIQYYWFVIAFLFVNFVLSLLLEEMLTKKLSTILFWASWFVLIIFTIASLPLFVGALW